MKRSALLLLLVTPMLFAQAWTFIPETPNKIITQVDWDRDNYMDFAKDHMYNRFPYGGGLTFPILEPETPPCAHFMDFDNDGNLDTLCEDWLYENRWPASYKRFQEFPDFDRRTIPAVGDYNKDGLLDMYLFITDLGGATSGHELWQNDFPNPFIPRFPQNQGDPDPVGVYDQRGQSNAAYWLDVDGDGNLDLLTSALTDDFPPSTNTLYYNEYPVDVFTNRSLISGLVTAEELEAGSTTLFLRPLYLDGDGLIDLMLIEADDSVSFMRNISTPGTPAFERITPDQHGFVAGGRYRPLPFDVDNDGDEDIYDGAGLWYNDGAGNFTRETGQILPNFLAQTAFDVDGDGWLDLHLRLDGSVNRFFINPGNENHWLQIQIHGDPNQNTPALPIGSTVRVRAGGVDYIRAYNVFEPNNKPLHFGLGDADLVEEIEVRWTGGGTTMLTDVSADQIITISQDPCFSDLIVTDMPDDLAFCSGEVIGLDATARGTGPFTYEWRLNGQTIQSETGPILGLVMDENGALAGEYECIVRTGNCSLATHSVNVVFRERNITHNTPDKVFLYPDDDGLFLEFRVDWSPVKSDWYKDGEFFSRGFTIDFDFVSESLRGFYQNEILLVCFGPIFSNITEVCVVSDQYFVNRALWPSVNTLDLVTMQLDACPSVE